MTFKNGIFYILLLVLSLTLINNDQAKATTVIKLDFDQVCQGAELIFEGKVISEETRSFNGKPFTYFTFQIIEVIKGSYKDPTIEIGFMGGTLGNATMMVSGMHVPKVGERGIYFVENLNVQQVHPLYGWQQGHYLVIPDKQTDQNVVIPMTMKDKESVETSSLASRNVLTLEVFKQNVRDVVGGGS